MYMYYGKQQHLKYLKTLLFLIYSITLCFGTSRFLKTGFLKPESVQRETQACYLEFLEVEKKEDDWLELCVGRGVPVPNYLSKKENKGKRTLFSYSFFYITVQFTILHLFFYTIIILTFSHLVQFTRVQRRESSMRGIRVKGVIKLFFFIFHLRVTDKKCLLLLTIATEKESSRRV